MLLLALIERHTKETCAMEVSCLVDEVRKYCTFMKLLQKSHKDTRNTFHDVNEAKCVIESKPTYCFLAAVFKTTSYNYGITGVIGSGV